MFVFHAAKYMDMNHMTGSYSEILGRPLFMTVPEEQCIVINEQASLSHNTSQNTSSSGDSGGDGNTNTHQQSSSPQENAGDTVTTTTNTNTTSTKIIFTSNSATTTTANPIRTNTTATDTTTTSNTGSVHRVSKPTSLPQLHCTTKPLVGSNGCTQFKYYPEDLVPPILPHDADSEVSNQVMLIIYLYTHNVLGILNLILSNADIVYSNHSLNLTTFLILY